MALQTSGAISLQDIQDEFGGSHPISLSEYYRGGGEVGSSNTNVPTSGQISLSQFYGATDVVFYTIDYLIVAGGGGGSANGYSDYSNAGGGAGGMESHSATISDGQAMAVTVGGGGAGLTGVHPCHSHVAGNGSNSSFNGHTASGGGGAGFYRNGNNGGSGGGGNKQSCYTNQQKYYSPQIGYGGSGVSGEGNDGGDGYTHRQEPEYDDYGYLTHYNWYPWSTAGGGGGKGSAGRLSDTRGNNQTSYSVVTDDYGYAIYPVGDPRYYHYDYRPSDWGDGAGSSWHGQGTFAEGGKATYSTPPNNDRAANSGSGGHGQFGWSGSFRGGTGGSGVVIIRYAGGQRGSGGNSIYSSGGYTYHKFTSSGTYNS